MNTTYRVATATAVTALVLAACTTDGSGPAGIGTAPSAEDTAAAGAEPVGAEPTTVTVAATDHAFDLPDEVEAGLVTFELTNRGEEIHHAQLVRVRPGGSLEEALAALGEEAGGEDLAALVEEVTFTGGVGVVAPGGRAASTLDLSPGEYAFFCGIPSPDGVPHFARGMVAAFSVTGGTPAEAPVVDTVGEVSLTEFAFGLPGDVDGTVAVTNDGRQPHEMLMIRLGEGVSLEEALASLEGPPPTEGPPPAVPVGGMQAIMPGGTGWLDLSTLAPGTYGLVCFLPDPDSGKAHVELGMVSQLRID